MDFINITKKLIEYNGVISEALEDEFFDTQEVTPNDFFSIFQDKVKKREFYKLPNITESNKGILRKNLMLSALIKSSGIVTNASKKIGITPQTHYDWIKNDPEYAQKVKDLDNYVFDFVEGKMLQTINNGDAGTIRWYLSTKGKSRGYGDPNKENTETPETTETNHVQTYLSNLLNPSFSTRVFRVFWEFLFQHDKKVFLSRGGTRSTKTHSKLDGLIALSFFKDNKSIIIVRRTAKLLDVVQNEFNKHLENNNLSECFDEKKSKRKYTNKKTGTTIQFVYFANVDDAKGQESDYFFLNEATETKFALFKHLIMRCQGKAILDFNPSDESTWCNTEIEQKRAIKNKDVQILVSTYKDNPFLPKHQLDEIESFKESSSEYWRIYGLGEYGRIEGKIFPNFELCSDLEFDEIPNGKAGFGVDWGFNDPTTVIYAKFDSRYNRLYLKEIDWFNQEPKNLDRVMDTLKDTPEFKKNSFVIIDHNPSYLGILQNEGFNALNADKGAGSIKEGINVMQEVEIIINENSSNLIAEFQNYSYEQDKDENWIDTPVDFMNHGIDASRYIFTFIIKNFKIDFGIKRKN